MNVIDLRSDFLAPASEAMHEAAAAARDSRHFGLREDPWQRKLEAAVAAMLGQEDALVFPTCTMANTVGLMLASAPGATALVPQGAHVATSEANAVAAIAGLAVTTVEGDGAFPSLASWQQALDAPPDPQRPRVAVAVLENTHMRAGGVALPRDYLDPVVAIAKARGVRLHLDGSRLLYASTALGASPAALAAGFDTVSISFNKTLGAPIAAALAGSAADIVRALTLRQRLGGGLRPTGASAAATLTGLQDLGHLHDCINSARRLAHALADLPHLAPERPPGQARNAMTNIVMTRVTAPWTAAALCDRLAAAGVLALPMGTDRVRFVTYRGIGNDHIDRSVAQLRAVLHGGVA